MAGLIGLTDMHDSLMAYVSCTSVILFGLFIGFCIGCGIGMKGIDADYRKMHNRAVIAESNLELCKMEVENGKTKGK